MLRELSAITMAASRSVPSAMTGGTRPATRTRVCRCWSTAIDVVRTAHSSEHQDCVNGRCAKTPEERGPDNQALIGQDETGPLEVAMQWEVLFFAHISAPTSARIVLPVEVAPPP